MRSQGTTRRGCADFERTLRLDRRGFLRAGALSLFDGLDKTTTFLTDRALWQADLGAYRQAVDEFHQRDRQHKAQ